MLEQAKYNVIMLCYVNMFSCVVCLSDRFMMLSLELHHSCRYDYVEVRDGDSIGSRVIGRFCGNNRPAPILSSGTSLHILFVSDGYKNFDGFFATFQEISGRSNTSDTVNRSTYYKQYINTYLLPLIASMILDMIFSTKILILDPY